MSKAFFKSRLSCAEIECYHNMWHHGSLKSTYAGNFYIWILLPGREIYFLGLPENLFQMLYSTCHHGYFCMYAKASLSQGYFKKERCLSSLPMYIGVPHTLCIIASPLPLIYDKPKSLI
jgi:hypothetical protein